MRISRGAAKAAIHQSRQRVQTRRLPATAYFDRRVSAASDQLKRFALVHLERKIMRNITMAEKKRHAVDIAVVGRINNVLRRDLKDREQWLHCVRLDTGVRGCPGLEGRCGRGSGRYGAGSACGVPSVEVGRSSSVLRVAVEELVCFPGRRGRGSARSSYVQGQ